MIVGSITLGVCALSAFAAFTAKETYRLRVEDLGTDVVPPSKEEYERLRDEAITEYNLANAKV